MFALNQADGVTGDAERDEVIIRGDGFPDDLEDGAGALVEGFDRGENGIVILPMRFGEDAFRADLVGIEAENLAAKLALDDNAVGTNRRLFGLC